MRKRKIFYCGFVLFALIFPFFISSVQATAGVPKILHHQGRLLDASGNLLGGAGTDFCFKFSFYDDATVGSPDNKLWPSGNPSTMTVSVKNGVFDVDIGDRSAGGDNLNFNFQDYDEVYLNIEVASKVGPTCNAGDGAESFENLAPRQRIYSSGYSINASTLGGFSASQTPTENQIPVLTNGNFTLTGSVGIGTTTPASALDVYGTSTIRSGLSLPFLISQNCLGTDSSGNVVAGSCGGGSAGAWATTTWGGAYYLGDILIGSSATATAKFWLATSTGDLIISGGLTASNVSPASTTLWNTAYGIVNASSSLWDLSYGIVEASSTKWDSGYGLLTASSTKWNTAYGWASSSLTMLNASSTKWDLNYGIVNASSSKWDNAVFLNLASSTLWSRTYGTVNASSSKWDLGYAGYTIVNASSTKWDIPYGITGNTTSTARTNLGLVIGTNVQAYDSDLNKIASLATTSGNIMVASTTGGWNTLAIGTNGLCLQASSSQPLGVAWASCATGGGVEVDPFWTASSTNFNNWNTAYDIVSSSSTSWDAGYGLLTASSTAWDAASGAINASSSLWDLNYGIVNASSSKWDTAYGLAFPNITAASSTRWNWTYGIINASSSLWDTKQPGDTDLTKIAGLATTSGNIMVASSTTGWNTLAVGASGLCLQASSSQPLGVAWGPCAAGGASLTGGQENYIPIWTSSTGLGTSTLSWNPSSQLLTTVGSSTVTGNLSATGAVTGSNISTASTTLWDAAYGIVNASSSKWDKGYAGYVIVNASSTKWDTAYGWASSSLTILNASSTKWDTIYGIVNASSSKWDLTYGKVNSSSTLWDIAYFKVNSSSTVWDRANFLTLASSTLWSGAYSTVNASSSKWDTSYGLTFASSSKWDLGYAGRITQFNTTTGNLLVASSTAGWTTLSKGSDNLCLVASSSQPNGLGWAACGGGGGAGVSSLNTLTGNLTLWGTSTSVTVNASGTTGLYVDVPIISPASTTLWNTSYSIINASSSKWDNAVFLNLASSTLWSRTYGTVNASSSKWDLGYAGYTVVNASSTKWDIPYGITGNTTSTARTNLGLVIGTNVQAYDAGLNTIAGLATTTGNLIVGTSSASGWAALAVGSSGKVLMASSSAPYGISWETVSSGGGGGGDGSGFGMESVQVFTGSDSWSKPAGITAVLVELVGGGGAGGDPTATNDGGGGGGAGGYSAEFIESGLNDTENVVIGSGGTGNNNAAGGAGGNTTFGTVAYLTGNGGNGGGGGAANSLDGGAGGSASGGDVNVTGGGGMAGDSSTPSSGNGAASYFGSGGAGINGNNVAGNNGSAYGSGGGGSTGLNPAGSGADGVVIVWEYSGTAGLDLAEWFATEDGAEAGDVVAMGSNDIAYDTDWGLQKIAVLKKAVSGDRLVGIVSTVPYQIMGSDFKKEIENSQPIALSGRVPVKVSTMNGPIEKGDLLTASDIPGVAIKTIKAGQIIGSALEDFDGPPDEIRKILVFVQTTYSTGARTNKILEKNGIEPDAIPPNTDIGRIILTQLINEKKNITATSSVSEIFTDRAVAGLEVISPRVLTDTLVVNSIEPVDKNITMKLVEGGKLIFERVTADELSLSFGDNAGSASSTPIVTIDDLGNAFFNGSLRVGALTIGSREKPNGITLFDTETSEPYCVKITKGYLVSVPGECNILTDLIHNEAVTSQDIQETAPAATTESPVVIINESPPEATAESPAETAAAPPPEATASLQEENQPEETATSSLENKSAENIANTERGNSIDSSQTLEESENGGLPKVDSGSDAEEPALEPTDFVSAQEEPVAPQAAEIIESQTENPEEILTPEPNQADSQEMQAQTDSGQTEE